MKQLTNEEWQAIERAYCSRSLAGFAKRAWKVLEPGTELHWGWVLDAMCEHLEAVTDGRINRLLMNVPPGFMKSLLVSVIWPCWEWGPKGKLNLSYTGTSHEEGLAIRDSRKMRMLIKSEWYQSLWPIELSSDLDGKKEFGNTGLGYRLARAFTSMTGRRSDRIILDDPISADGANSEAKRLEVERAFTETLPTRVNNKNSAIVVIMQRLHQGDPSGLIIDRELPYTHLCIPMRFEETRPPNAIGWQDPRTVDGELAFPDRFDEDQVSELEKVMGSYAVAGQFQQRPAPRDGGMFKRAWFEIVGAAPVGTEWVRGWDLAASTGKDSAYTAGVKIGRTPEGRYIVADSSRGQLSAAGVEQLIVNTATQDGAECHVSIPQDPGQAGKAQSQYLISRLSGFVAKATPESGDKETRALPFAAQAEAGNVSIIRGSWNEAFLDEMATFPNGKFKDQVDAATRAFDMLQKPKMPVAISGVHGSGY